MSRNDILPKGMYWYHSPKTGFILIVEKSCKYRKVEIDLQIEPHGVQR